jgi:hypothetical protein
MMLDSDYKEESSIASEDHNGVDVSVDNHMEGIPAAVGVAAIAAAIPLLLLPCLLLSCLLLSRMEGVLQSQLV